MKKARLIIGVLLLGIILGTGLHSLADPIAPDPIFYGEMCIFPGGENCANGIPPGDDSN